MDREFMFELRQTFDEEELRGHAQRFDRMTAGQNFSQQELQAQRQQYFRDVLNERRSAEQAAIGRMRSDPNFQKAVVGEALGAPFDPTREFMSIRETAEAHASPLIGTAMRLATFPFDPGLFGLSGQFQGGYMDVEGEFLDVQARYPGRDVRIIPVPDQGGMKPVVVVQDDNGEFVPANMPGPSPADFGMFLGDLMNWEGVGGLASYLGGPGGRLIGRAFRAAIGAGIGGTADEVIQQSQHGVPDDFSRFAENVGMRGLFGFGTAFGGEYVAAGLGAGAQYLAGRHQARGSGERAAYDRAARVQALGAPVHAGQVSPASWSARMRARWSMLSPEIREQSLRQVRWLGEDQRQIAQEFLGMDGVDQAIAGAGMSIQTLDLVEREVARELGDKALEALRARGAASRSEAGAGIRQAIGDLTDKDAQSYRTLAYARMNELENQLLDVVDDSGSFYLDPSQVRRTAQEALSHINMLQQQTGRAAREITDREQDLLGVGVEQVHRKFNEDLKFVLEHLANLPEEMLASKGIYQVRAARAGDLMGDRFRVDAMGNVRTTYERGGMGNSASTRVAPQDDILQGMGLAGVGKEGRILGTYEVNGVQMLKVFRSMLRDNFDNPLLHGSSADTNLARKIYLQLGEVLENSTSSDFNAAVRNYNAESSRMLGVLDELRVAGFMQQGDAQGVVTKFTDGAMGFRTLSTLRDAMMETGERGAKAWEGFRASAARDFINNPEKIKNLDVEPSTSSLLFSPEEQAILRDYAVTMQIANNQGPVAIAARASGVRGRALALFRTIPDNETFSRVWKNMSETDRNVMRYTVVEDLLDSATHVKQGEANVLDPKLYSEAVQSLLQGDTGDRIKIILPKDALDRLVSGQDIAAFYADVLRHTDVGASIGASEQAFAVQREAMRGSMTGILTAGLNVKINQWAAASLVDGVLGRVLAPNLKPASQAIYQAQALAFLATTGMNANAQVADADAGFDKRMQEAIEKAMREEVRRQRRAAR